VKSRTAKRRTGRYDLRHAWTRYSWAVTGLAALASTDIRDRLICVWAQTEGVEQGLLPPHVRRMRTRFLARTGWAGHIHTTVHLVSDDEVRRLIALAIEIYEALNIAAIEQGGLE
jgi:hypothetical protein